MHPWLIATVCLVFYKFLKINKGTFRFDSKLGEGSAFTISLPRKEG